MTISNRTLIFKCHPKCSSSSLLCLACGCWRRHESESRENHWGFVLVLSFPWGLSTWEVVWIGCSPVAALLLSLSPLLMHSFDAEWVHWVSAGAGVPQVMLSVYQNQIKRPKRCPSFCRCSFSILSLAGSVPRASLLELKSVLGICKMVICFCKWSKVSCFESWLSEINLLFSSKTILIALWNPVGLGAARV